MGLLASILWACKHDITWYMLRDPDRKLERQPEKHVEADGRHDIRLRVHGSDDVPSEGLAVLLSSDPQTLWNAWTNGEGEAVFPDRAPGRYRFQFWCGTNYFGSGILDLPPEGSITVRFYLNRSWTAKLPCQIEPPPECRPLGEPCRWGAGSHPGDAAESLE